MIYSPFGLDPRHFVATSYAVPMVLLGQYVPHSTADYVAIDNLASAREATRHLVDGPARDRVRRGAAGTVRGDR